MYSPSQLDLEDAELTQTDEEFTRDEPISILEIPQIYAEGVHHDGHNSDENNRTKRARVTPLALKYSAWKRNVLIKIYPYGTIFSNL